MKRTYGKTKTRPRRRKISITLEGRVLEQRWAPSLTQALREFAKDRGLKNFSAVGNVMTWEDATFIAKEAK